MGESDAKPRHRHGSILHVQKLGMIDLISDRALRVHGIQSTRLNSLDFMRCSSHIYVERVEGAYGYTNNIFGEPNRGVAAKVHEADWSQHWRQAHTPRWPGESSKERWHRQKDWCIDQANRTCVSSHVCVQTSYHCLPLLTARRCPGGSLSVSKRTARPVT